MLFLIASIVLASYLTLSFKVVERLRISIFQTIVFNYVACVVAGSVFTGYLPITTTTFSQPWFKWALLMGGSFITIFNIVGVTTQKIGVAVASVANKLSMVIPFVCSIWLYNEITTGLKWVGIVLALIAVYLTMRQAPDNKNAVSNKWLLFLPVILFITSGLLDTMIKYVEQHFLNETNNNEYLITAFASAGIIGLCLLFLVVITGKQKFDYRAIVAGFGIGVPNYFSIWCLLRVLKQYAGNSSAIIPINNMGIVLFSAVMAWIVFKEKLSIVNWAGIILSLGAIALIAYG
jgi:drug/metabolite transporter (DMT)-like permease